MRFFIDTANLDEIREAASWGIIEGCTTNPSLVARAGGDFVENVRAICELVQGPVSAEVVATDTEGMLREARWLARIHEHVVVKIPMTAKGLAAVKRLSAEGIRTNVTLVFQPAQALLAARAGATYVSPFVGRLDDVGEDGMELVRQVVEIFEDDPEIRTEVIVASVRHPRHVVEAALAGAQIATVPFAVLKKLLHHPLTERGIERFLADWEPLQVDIERDVRRFLEARGEL